MLVLYDAKASKQLDAAILKTGIHEVLLMMRAASSIFDVVENLTNANRVISIARPGSNGGDAYGVAILSAIAGKSTNIYSISDVSGERFEKVVKDILPFSLPMLFVVFLITIFPNIVIWLPDLVFH